LGGVRGAVLAVPGLARCDAWKTLARGGSSALEFGGDEHARYGGQSFKELAADLLRRRLIPPPFDQAIPEVAVLIDRPPEILTRALAGQKPLVPVPLIARPRAAAPQLVGLRLANLAAPLANSLIGHDYPTFPQYFFHIPKAQAEAQVQPYSVTTDLHRNAVVLIFLRS
jgi:hypothetical protein